MISIISHFINTSVSTRDGRESLFTFTFLPIPMQSILIPSHSHAINSHSFPFPCNQFPFLPIPMQSISIPSHCHSQFCDYSHSRLIPMNLFPFTFHAVDRNIMNFYTCNLCEKKQSSLLKTAVQELCRFCCSRSCFVSKQTLYIVQR